MKAPTDEKTIIATRAERYRVQFPTKKACMKRINKTIDSFNGKSLKHNIELKTSYNNALELRAELVKMD